MASSQPAGGTMSKFFLGSQTVEDVTFLKVSGTIDEDNTLASSLKKIDGHTVVVDLAGVERINSCGVRDWVNWLNDLEGRGKQVVLVRCSPVIVNQVNLVHNFAGRGHVKSFFAPYYCGRCDREQLRLVQAEELGRGAGPKAPKVLGEGCNTVPCEMAFDDLEEAYFSFLPRAGAVAVDQGLQKLIDGFSPSLKDRIKRLDAVEKGSGEGGAPSTSQYSPLTGAGSGLSLNLGGTSGGRSSLSGQGTPATAPAARSSVGFRALIGAAALVALAIVGYVVFYVFGA
jgi:anti-anti-sigma regulatory factor